MEKLSGPLRWRWKWCRTQCSCWRHRWAEALKVSKVGQNRCLSRLAQLERSLQLAPDDGGEITSAGNPDSILWEHCRRGCRRGLCPNPWKHHSQREAAAGKKRREISPAPTDVMVGGCCT